MYKKFSLKDLSTIQNNFIPHLYKIIQQEKCQGVNDFFKFAFKEGHEVLFFNRSNIAFRIGLENDLISITDEVEKIQVQIPAHNKSGLQDLLKNYISKKQRQF
jgi:SpoU rRNA methylase family enzyme